MYHTALISLTGMGSFMILHCSTACILSVLGLRKLRLWRHSPPESICCTAVMITLHLSSALLKCLHNLAAKRECLNNKFLFSYAAALFHSDAMLFIRIAKEVSCALLLPMLCTETQTTIWRAYQWPTFSGVSSKPNPNWIYALNSLNSYTHCPPWCCQPA